MYILETSINEAPTQMKTRWLNLLYTLKIYSSSYLFLDKVLSISLTQVIDFPGGSVVKNTPANAGDAASNPGSERSPGEENVNPLQYSWLGSPMDRGAWQATVHGFTKELDVTQWLSNNNKQVTRQGIQYHCIESNCFMGKLYFSNCLRCGSETKTNILRYIIDLKCLFIKKDNKKSEKKHLIFKTHKSTQHKKLKRELDWTKLKRINLRCKMEKRNTSHGL